MVIKQLWSTSRFWVAIYAFWTVSLYPFSVIYYSYLIITRFPHFFFTQQEREFIYALYLRFFFTIVAIRNVFSKQSIIRNFMFILTREVSDVDLIRFEKCYINVKILRFFMYVALLIFNGWNHLGASILLHRLSCICRSFSRYPFGSFTNDQSQDWLRYREQCEYLLREIMDFFIFCFSVFPRRFSFREGCPLVWFCARARDIDKERHWQRYFPFIFHQHSSCDLPRKNTFL